MIWFADLVRMERGNTRILFVLCLCLFAVTASAQEFANVEYLCADWGPAMKLPGKTNEPPVFSDTEEEVYFLKQVGRFTRKIRTVPDLFSGSRHEDVGKGVNVYLCKMKPDGTGKTELRELWHDVRYPIDTQGQCTWMDVNEKTRTLALSVTFAGSDITGLWTMKLDGSELKRIITPDRNVSVPDSDKKALQAIDSPSWTPDGQWIVFGESWRGADRSQIAKCDRDGKNFTRLTEDIEDMQPRVSPDGKQIAYIHAFKAATWLYLINLDGTNQRALPNPANKKWGTHGGTYPAWSPDGGRIYGISMGIVNAISGRLLGDSSPILQGRLSTCGWSHWGKLGFIGFNVGGIKVTDSDLRESKWIGSSKLLDCSESKEGCDW